MTDPTKASAPASARSKATDEEKHFATAHLLGDLRRRTLSGGFITAVAQSSKLGLTLISAVVMARLLTPEDFGVVAMVGSITGFLLVFKDAGLSTATIQKANITHAQVSNLFWINLGVSVTLSLLVAALAPAVAWFYRDPRMIEITLALAGTFALSGAVVQHQALLNRQLRFKAVAVIDVGSATVGLIVGIVMACFKFRYWSLVGMQLSTGFAELILTLSISGWRPQRPRRRTETRSLIHFGASLTVASIFRRLANGCDSLFIGRWYGAVPVGLYNRASVLFIRPIGQLTGPFESVLTPVLSHLQEDTERYRRTFLRAYGAVTLVWLPITGMFMALSHPLVVVLLGAKWEKAVPIFGWFCVAGLFLPQYCFVSCLLNTQGRGKDIMIMGLIFSVTTVGSIFAGLPWGPVGVALSTSCVGLLVRLPVQFYIVGREGPVRTSDLWAASLKYLPNWVIVVSVTYMTLRALPSHIPPILQLCICTPIGLVTGLLLALVLPSQKQETLYVWELVNSFVLKRLRGRGFSAHKAGALSAASAKGSPGE